MSAAHAHRDLYIGIAATVLAAFVLAGMDTIAKFLMRSLPTEQVVWARFFFHLLLVGAIFARRGNWSFVRTRHPVLQTVRGATLVGVTLSLYSAIRNGSLAEATAIVFFAPVLVTVLSGPMLGERVRHWHWLAVFLGFAGVLVIVRPGFREHDSALWLACVAAVSLALYFVLTRRLRGLDSERTTLFHTTLGGSVLLSILAGLSWQAPTAAEWAVLVGIGALGAGGHLLLVRAFHLAPASTLAPFLNAQLVAAAIYSAVFFNDVLDLPFLAGTALIVGAGLWVSQRDRRALPRPAP